MGTSTQHNMGNMCTSTESEECFEPASMTTRIMPQQSPETRISCAETSAIVASPASVDAAFMASYHRRKACRRVVKSPPTSRAAQLNKADKESMCGLLFV